MSARWSTANVLYADVKAQCELVDFLGTRPTADAAREVCARLEAFQEEVYQKAKDGQKFLTEDEYLQRYHPLRGAFIDAAKQELGI